MNEPEERLTVFAHLTCHTTGCENDDIEVTAFVDAETLYAICGPCNGPITDLTTTQEEPP